MKQGRPERFAARQLPLLRALTRPDQDALLALCAFRRLDRGDKLISVGQRADHAYLVVEGGLCGGLTNVFGRGVVVKSYGPGALIGLPSGSSDESHMWDTVANTPCLVASMRTQDLFGCLMQHPIIGVTLLQAMAECHLTDIARIYELSALDVRVRLHSALVNWAAMNESPRAADGVIAIDNFPSHSYIATMVGATREAVNRELRALHKRGVIRGTTKRIEVCDLAYLEASVLRRGGVDSASLIRRRWRRLYTAIE